MRVGIITFTYGDNYGQRLQNLAMQELLKKYFEEVYTIKQVEPSKTVKLKIKSILDLNRKKRHFKFQEFDKKYITYFSIDISEQKACDFPEEMFDFFVAGSDQIWSPYSKDVNSTMFLTFAPIRKRIALSPSLSCESIPDEKIEEFSKYLNGIKFVSTREEKGSRIVSEIIKKEVPTLLDPTLMHDKLFWRKYECKPNFTIPSEYCLCYCLGNNDNLEKIQQISFKNKLKIIDIMQDSKYYTLGPEEFLYLIDNARLVITDSYHGTIFSYIFKTPFLNFKRKGTRIDMNSRFETLYKKMNISPRLLENIDEEEIFKLDFNRIDKNINAERKKVNNFIINFKKAKEVINK